MFNISLNSKYLPVDWGQRSVLYFNKLIFAHYPFLPLHCFYLFPLLTETKIPKGGAASLWTKRTSTQYPVCVFITDAKTRLFSNNRFANIRSKQSRGADKGWSSALKVERGANNLTVKKSLVRNCAQSLGIGRCCEDGNELSGSIKGGEFLD